MNLYQQNKLDKTQKPYLNLSKNPKNDLQKVPGESTCRQIIFFFKYMRNIYHNMYFLFSYLCSEIKTKPKNHRLRESCNPPPLVNLTNKKKNR